MRQARLLGALLVGPFFLAAAAAQVFVPGLGAAAALAAICGLLAAAWLAVVAVTTTGRDTLAAGAMLAMGAPAVGSVIAAAGGIASPLSLLALGLVVEPYWVARTPRSAWLGSLAAIGAFVVQAMVAPALAGADIAASAWHWLVPAGYVLSLLPRLHSLLGVEPHRDADDEHRGIEDFIDAVVFRMTLNGDVADVSRKARDILDLQPELLLSSGLLDRIHVADRVAYLSALADIRDGAASRNCELRLRLPRRADGPAGDNYRLFCVELVRAGDAREIVVLLRQALQTEELRGALALAREAADRNSAAKDRFLATVSHELRTPLNAIIGFSDMLAHGMCGRLDDPRQREYVCMIRDSGNHLLAVVNSILDVSKIEAGSYDIHPEPFRFRDAVDMCRAMLSPQADAKKLRLDMHVAGAVGDVVADSRAIRQILINLVSNAIKFTPEGGTISLAAKRLGSRLHFSVADTGIGIAEADLGRIGQPFTQIQNDYTRQFEGTGLGLSVVRGLVGLHQGTMTIESALGQGTTVAISLPIDGPATWRASRGELLSMKAAETREEIDGTLRKIA
ncbi:sensor histidine kinase [Mesorhizobium sp. L-8-3]|uniref:sensor histidine kinase n=1 Tax=Mesorhizobium sp. L-8-3 TaxID=2744522 RepID=UPI001937BBBE|nr:PAS domain-containing protein [Mesorhizobium sp. L-8-3]BCH26030.1 ATPase [Mesorhizobium sp. L-8-3]